MPWLVLKNSASLNLLVCCGARARRATVRTVRDRDVAEGSTRVEQMRIAVGQVSELTDEILAFARQLGVGSMQVNLLGRSPLPGAHRWEYEDLRALASAARSRASSFEAIENVHLDFYDKVMLGLPGRDEQIEHYCATVRNMGRAGIPILGYHFTPEFCLAHGSLADWAGRRTRHSFDMAAVEARASDILVARTDRSGSDDPFDTKGIIPASQYRLSEAEMWANYDLFHQGGHPRRGGGGRQTGAPPRRPAGPIARRHRAALPQLRGFRRAMEIADSDSLGAGSLPRLLVRDGRRGE